MSENRLEKGRDRPKLLLVDDDPTFCQVLSQSLTKRNYDVRVAHDLNTGCAIADDQDILYAVVDLRIGQESGLEMVSQLHSRHQNMRIIVLTGYASIATAVEAVKLGATHYLTKPANPDEIIAALLKSQGNPMEKVTDRPLSVKRLEWEHLQKVLMEHNGNISAAARALGMHRRTLQRKLDKRPVKK